MYKKLMTFCLTNCLGITNSTGLFADTLVDIVRETISTNPDIHIAKDMRNAIKFNNGTNARWVFSISRNNSRRWLGIQ